MLITDTGTIIRINVSEISVLGRSTQGVTLMRTNEGKVVSIEKISEEDVESEEWNKGVRMMKIEEATTYIENETMLIIQLYTEAYMSEKEKGFKTLGEKQNRLERLEADIKDVIKDCSEYTGIDIEKVNRIILECLNRKKVNSEIRIKQEEEYRVIEDVLGKEEKDISHEEK